MKVCQSVGCGVRKSDHASRIHCGHVQVIKQGAILHVVCYQQKLGYHTTICKHTNKQKAISQLGSQVGAVVSCLWGPRFESYQGHYMYVAWVFQSLLEFVGFP